LSIPSNRWSAYGHPYLERHAGLIDRETKFARVDLGTVEADGSFSGYASVFGKPDLAGDIVMPGAFAKSLSTRGAGGIKLLFQHDPGEPIGAWLDIREDQTGLFVRGRLLPEVNRAREVLALMRAGVLDGLSIGFRTVRAKAGQAVANTTHAARQLLEVDLWEISVVTFPMLPEARVGQVKTNQAEASTLPPQTEREFERWLIRDCRFSRKQARTVIAAGYKALTPERDAGPRNDKVLADRIRSASRALKV
jgi:HK97 family phage prohead protease